MPVNDNLIHHEPISPHLTTLTQSRSLRKDHRIVIKIIEAKFPSLQNNEVDSYATLRIYHGSIVSATRSPLRTNSIYFEKMSNASSGSSNSNLNAPKSPRPLFTSLSRGSLKVSTDPMILNKSATIHSESKEKLNTPTTTTITTPTTTTITSLNASSTPSTSISTSTSALVLSTPTSGNEEKNIIATFKTHTLTKVKNFCFWDQEFKIQLPPDLNDINIEISVWSKRLLGNTLLGQVILNTTNLDTSSPVETWVQLYSSKEKNMGSLRLRYHYVYESILPLHSYKPLVNLLIDPNIHVVTCLERVLIEKNSIAQVFVPVMHALDLHVTYLSGLGRSEIASTTEPTLLFRANSLATKSIEHFMKWSSGNFLHLALKPVIKLILAESKSCELDPHRTNPDELGLHLQVLVGYLNKFIDKIVMAVDACPRSLRSIFGVLQKEANLKWPHTDMGYIAVSSFIFLRFINAAILGPKLFGLCEHLPNATCLRTLTLISKTLQQLANISLFDGSKEPFMKELNPFLTKTFPVYRGFINSLTGATDSRDNLDIAFPKCLEDKGIMGLSSLITSLPKNLFNKTKDSNEDLSKQEAPDIELQMAEVLRLLSRHIDAMESQANGKELPTILNLKSILLHLLTTQKLRENQTLPHATIDSVLIGTGMKSPLDGLTLPHLSPIKDNSLTNELAEMILPEN